MHPPLARPSITPEEDVEMQRCGRYAAHSAFAEGVQSLREWLSFVPSTGDQEQVRVERCLAYLLPARSVLLKLDNLMAKCAESFGYILLGRKLRLMISDISNSHALVALDVNDLPQRVLHLHKISSVGHDNVYVFVRGGDFVDESIGIAVLDALHCLAQLIKCELFACC
jgi:hypothetical protein